MKMNARPQTQNPNPNLTTSASVFATAVSPTKPHVDPNKIKIKGEEGVENGKRPEPYPSEKQPRGAARGCHAPPTKVVLASFFLPPTSWPPIYAFPATRSWKSPWWGCVIPTCRRLCGPLAAWATPSDSVLADLHDGGACSQSGGTISELWVPDWRVGWCFLASFGWRKHGGYKESPLEDGCGEGGGGARCSTPLAMASKSSDREDFWGEITERHRVRSGKWERVKIRV